MSPLNLLINLLISGGLMSIFIYIFYFLVITKIEAELLNKIMGGDLIKKFNNNKPIEISAKNEILLKKKNNKIIKRGQIVFFTLGAFLISIGLILIYYYNLSFYEILLHNIVIITATLIAELIFLFTYTRKYIVFDNSTLINYSIEIMDNILDKNYKKNNNYCNFN